MEEFKYQECLLNKKNAVKHHQKELKGFKEQLIELKKVKNTKTKILFPKKLGASLKKNL